MTKKILKLVSALLTAILCISRIAVNAQSDADYLIDRIIDWKLLVENYDDSQQLIDGWLPENTGDADWYAICLSKNSNYDFSMYNSSIENNIDTNHKPIDLIRMAIAYKFTDGENLNFDDILSKSDNDNVMCKIYSLILMNMCGYNFELREASTLGLISLQLDSGGWALSGKYSDIDVTAMALQALAPYKNHDFAKQSILSAINLLSNMQQTDGGYKSYGTVSSESCAQVIIALCQLGINPETDERFIKNGHSVIDKLLEFRLENGGFSHTLNGNANDKSTVQALTALEALREYRYTSQGFYPYELESTNENIIITAAENAETDQSFTDALESTDDNSITKAVTTETETIASGETDQEIYHYTSESTNDNSTTSAATTETEIIVNGETDKKSSPSLRIYIYIAILVILICYNIYLLIKKIWKPMKFVVSLVVSVSVCICISFITVQMPDEYYNKHTDIILPDSNTVTMSINYTAINEEEYLISPSNYVLLDGETAFDLLKRVTAAEKIPIDYVGVSNKLLSTIYITGINNIYEMDYGETSGWMYTVNGVFPDCSCGDYLLSDGDVIEWIYSISEDSGIRIQVHKSFFPES